MFEPTDDGTQSRIFVSKSYDATSHFQTVSADVHSIYKVRASNYVRRQCAETKGMPMVIML